MCTASKYAVEIEMDGLDLEMFESDLELTNPG